jgi:hypothetical protein
LIPRFRVIVYIAGCPDCLSKPFTEQEVVKKVILASRNLTRLVANWLLIKTKLFAPESTSIEV